MQFARTVVEELKSAARLHKHPLKSAGFKVLWRRTYRIGAGGAPATVSTKDDLKQLTSASWRAHAAQALAQAVDAYFTPRVGGGWGTQLNDLTGLSFNIKPGNHRRGGPVATAAW